MRPLALSRLVRPLSGALALALLAGCASTHDLTPASSPRGGLRSKAVGCQSGITGTSKAAPIACAWRTFAAQAAAVSAARRKMAAPSSASGALASSRPIPSSCIAQARSCAPKRRELLNSRRRLSSFCGHPAWRDCSVAKTSLAPSRKTARSAAGWLQASADWNAARLWRET
ncbi:MAG: hypothetical protein J0L70_27855 [Leptolyngbya sp. UWPOB_LEPTO1]|uniref:hypothetical protein n=1 Tax=Leptolyngbya sp. UWPOB_LEPTO1 TaxID=2815653 RepID=UPI001AC770F6|nr:hypothetical protein [Leptolyngbya sp. UWPOB_LEPTO1]